MTKTALYILIITPFVAKYIEYILSSQKHLNVQQLLHRISSHLDNISLPRLGLTEATLCLKVFDYLFSPRALSLKRLISTSICILGFGIVYYVFIVFFCLYKETSVYSPTHYYYYIVIQFWPLSNASLVTALVSGIFSLSVTRAMLKISIRICGSLNSLSTAGFIGFAFLTAWMASLITGAIEQISHSIVLNILAILFWIDWNSFGGFPGFLTDQKEAFYQAAQEEITWLEKVWIPYVSLSKSFMLNPFEVLGDQISLPAVTKANPIGLYLVFEHWVRLCFAELRLIFAIVFVAFWFLHYLHKAIATGLRRFLALKTGALTTMAIIADLIATAILNLRSL